MPEYRASDRAQQVNLAGDNTGHITVSTVYQTTPRPMVTNALRRDVTIFVGRDRELQRILEAAGPGRVVSIHTVDGMPGVGKTALVTRAAHALAEQFPDGRYFIELHAHTPGQIAADPADVLAGLLIELGIDPGSIPDGLVARRDLWRDQLTDKRVLLVLDDARDATQIEPLLPAGRDCVTIVTSRRRLIALDDALPLALEILDPHSAAELFTTLARRSVPDGADREAVAEIVEMCGYLPLAIVLLAGRLAHHPAWTITWLAKEFKIATDRLGELDTGGRAVRAAFTMSYTELPPERQRLFRYLALHPGLDTDVDAAAALAGIPTSQAQRQLEALYVDHLVDETMPGRYRLHDLLREYARQLVATDPTEDTDLAVEQLLDYYEATAAAADRHLSRLPRSAADRTTSLSDDAPGVPVRDFADEVQAVAWMRVERANLIACLEHSVGHRPARVASLTGVLAGLLERDGPWSQAQQLHQRAVTTAKLVGDMEGAANALDDLGLARRRFSDFNEAADLHQQSLTIYREIGNRCGEATALDNLGRVRWRIGDYADAADLHQQSLTIYRGIGNRLGEANALTHLGGVNWRLGDYIQAIDLHQQALVIYWEIGDLPGEASVLTNLGSVYWRTGDYAQAADLHQQALITYREIGNRLGEANALDNLGSVCRQLGDSGQATDLFTQALRLYREIGSRHGEGSTLNHLGGVFRGIGDRGQAVDLFRQALSVYRQIGNRLGEAEVLNETGQMLIEDRQLEDALRMFTDAFQLAHHIRSLFEQARALEGAGRCQAGLDETDIAVTQLSEAVDIYGRLGVPEAESAAAYLAKLQHDPPPSH